MVSAQTAIDRLNQAASPTLKVWMRRHQGALARVVGGTLSMETAPEFSRVETIPTRIHGKQMTFSDLLRQLRDTLSSEEEEKEAIIKAIAYKSRKGVSFDKGEARLYKAIDSYVDVIFEIVAAYKALYKSYHDILMTWDISGTSDINRQGFVKLGHMFDGIESSHPSIIGELEHMSSALRNERTSTYRVGEFHVAKWMQSTGKGVQSLRDWNIGTLKHWHKRVYEWLTADYPKTDMGQIHPDLPAGGFEAPQEERVTLEGFPCILVGFKESISYHQRAFSVLVAALARYRQQAARYLPELLQSMKLPFRIFFTKVDFGGQYNVRYISLAPINYYHRDELVKTIAHEMGHAYYHQRLSGVAKEDWNLLVGAEEPLDVRKVLDAWDSVASSSPDLSNVIMNALRDLDPLTYLQLRIACTDYSIYGEMPSRKDDDALCNWSRERFEKTALNAPLVRLHPVSVYGATNPDEAWSETIGYLIAYGPQAVPPILRELVMRLIPTLRRNPHNFKAFSYGARA